MMFGALPERKLATDQLVKQAWISPVGAPIPATTK